MYWYSSVLIFCNLIHRAIPLKKKNIIVRNYVLFCTPNMEIMVNISRDMVMGDSRDEPFYRISLPSRVFCTEFSPFEWSAKWGPKTYTSVWLKTILCFPQSFGYWISILADGGDSMAAWGKWLQPVPVWDRARGSPRHQVLDKPWEHPSVSFYLGFKPSLGVLQLHLLSPPKLFNLPPVAQITSWDFSLVTWMK